MVVFVIAEDIPYILLGRDHPSVRSWICRNPTAKPQADPLRTPLTAITRVQSQELAEGHIPGIRKDIRAYRSACAECQWGQLKPKVPMVQTPTILVPYQRMALDLVGPLNRTVKGYRYISTVMCLGTRNPYAVALKKIDAEL